MSIHDSFLDFLSELDGLRDPLCCPVRLTADDSRLVTVDDMILCVDVICDC